MTKYGCNVRCIVAMFETSTAAGEKHGFKDDLAHESRYNAGWKRNDCYVSCRVTRQLLL